MEKSQGTTIFSFIKWLAERYIQLERRTLPNPCKLVNVISKNNNHLVQIQLSGQSHVIEIDPKKIIEQNLFEYFSSQDKKKLFSIVYLKNQLILSDKYLCQDSNKEMVVLTDIITGNKITISAEMASLNGALISQINSKDANKIGFIAGMEFTKKYFNHLKASQ
jgi:hypothetical protein